MDFSGAVLDGIPILPIIIGLVEYSKKFGAEGIVCDALSMGLGVVFGLLYQLSVSGTPSDLSGWFGVVLYGLGLGLVSSGLWAAAFKKNKCK